MKTYSKVHFRMSVILITLFIFLCLPVVKLYSQEFSLIKNIKLPSGANLGANLGAPVGDMISADGKIFLYSPEGLIIYDPSSNQPFSSVDFPGHYGKFNPVYFSYNGNSDANLMTLNEEDNLLYVVTSDLRIMKVDIDTYIADLILEVTPEDIAHFKTLHGYNIIKFDAVHDRLYWLVEGRNVENEIGNFHHRDTYLAVYSVSPDGSALSLINALFTNGQDNYYETIYDIEFNDTNDYFYVAKKKHLEIWEVVGTNTLSLRYTRPTLAGKCGKLLYIHNNQIHKILALPYRLPFTGNNYAYEPPMEANIKFYVIDGDENDPFVVDSVSAPSKRIMDGVFLTGANDLILCYSPDYYIQDYYPVDPESDVAFYHFNGEYFNYQGWLKTNGFPQYNSSVQMMNRPLKMFINNSNSLIIGKTHEVVRLIKNDTYTSSQLLNGESNYFGKAVKIGSKDYILNPTLNGLAVYNEINSTDSYIRTAYPVYNICANPVNGNLYFSNRLSSENSGFYVYNPGTGLSFNINEYGSNSFTKAIGDLIYNHFTGHYLVSENTPAETNNQAHVKVYDGNTNNLLNPQPIAINGTQYIKEMFISPEGWLYIMVNMHEGLEPKIVICKAENYSEQTVVDLSQILPGYPDPFFYYVANFLYNPRDRMVYITLSPNDTIMGPYNDVSNSMCDYQPGFHTQNGLLMKFSGNQLVDSKNLHFPGEIICPDAEAPDMISDYDSLMFIKTNRLAIYNYKKGSLPQTIEQKFNDITYSAYYDKIYGLRDEASQISGDSTDREINIYQINPDGSTDLKFKHKGQAAAFFSNPYDTMLYLIVKIDNIKLGDTLSCLLQLNPGGEEFLEDTVQLLNTDFYVDLDHNGNYRFYFYNIITPFIDRYSNQIYLPNGGHSNVSVVSFKAEEPLFLDKGWNWISFPRLDRVGNEAVPSQPLLESIIPFPSYLQMKHLDPETQQLLDKSYEIPDWSGILDEVKSSLGYKLETDNPEVSVLPMSGSILSPETTFPLFGLKSNWTGYYLTRTQSPFDAIAPEFLDKIDGMQGHYWYCHKEINHTKNSGYWWRCACSQGSIELKYADMIVIYPSENIGDFHWQYAGQPSLEDPKDPSLSFQYQEQAEYDALIIELDTMNRPEEIGAFAGDSCIGATTVLPADTTVLICAYTQGFEGQEITFDLLYPTKSSRPRCDDYLVLNTNTGIHEQRRIVAGEKQPYFLVSLKPSLGQLPLAGSSWLQCQPNPAGNEVTVSYFLDKEANVSLQLTNALGSMVMSWQRGLQSAGSYDFRFSTANLTAGCYQLRMSAGNSNNMQKLLIIH